MTQANYIDTQEAVADRLTAFNKESSATSNSFLELFKDSINNPSPYASTHIESASQDIPVETLHYENVELVFEDHEEPTRYIARSEITGRPLPNAFILDAFDIDIDDNALDSPAVFSHSSDLSTDDLLSQAITLIDEHYDYYGAMFSRELVEDVNGMAHLQSALLVRSYSTPRPHLFTPIMGVNALNIALKRVAYSRESEVELGNIFTPTKVKEDPSAVFFFDYVGHAASIPRQHYIDAIFLGDHVDDEDSYVENEAAIAVVATITCLDKDELPDFRPYVDSNPFQWVGLGHQAVPAMWPSLIHNHFADNEDYELASKACLKYSDVFAFWLAASSGLALSAFSSFNSSTSDFHDLSVENKTRALLEMMPLVENIALKMQSSDFLLQTPLINLYEL